MFFAIVIHFMLGASSSPRGTSVLGQISLYFSIITSYLSYLFLAVATPAAYEVCYTCLALVYTLVALRFIKRAPSEQRYSVLKALLCCAGFVLFKQNDFYLADLHMLFEIFSGHFLSRLCDVYQFYYFFSVIELHFFDTEHFDESDSRHSLKVE